MPDRLDMMRAMFHVPPLDRQRDFLFVQSTTEVGGAEVVLLSLFEESAELRTRGMVVTLGFGSGNLPARLRELGVDVVEMKMPRLRQAWKLAPILARLRALARRRGVRVVIGNGGHPQIVAGVTARLAGARTVFIAHMIYPHPIWKNDPRDALALLGPLDLILAVSKSARATLSKLRPSVPNALMYNGTPVREVAPDEARAARQELGVAEDEILIGVFGRLQRWKGQDVFVEAAAEVARARPAAKFMVVGGSVFGLEREFAEALRCRAEQLDLSGRLTFTGFRTDVPRLMAACDVVCHTSRVPEPFGLVVVEAMGLGRATIATEGGGPSEIITAESGVLVPPEDSGTLARAIVALIDDPARRHSLGDRARERARREFSMEKMAATLLHHLNDLTRA